MPRSNQQSDSARANKAEKAVAKLNKQFAKQAKTGVSAIQKIQKEWKKSAAFQSKLQSKQVKDFSKAQKSMVKATTDSQKRMLKSVMDGQRKQQKEYKKLFATVNKQQKSVAKSAKSSVLLPLIGVGAILASTKALTGFVTQLSRVRDEFVSLAGAGRGRGLLGGNTQDDLKFFSEAMKKSLSFRNLTGAEMGGLRVLKNQLRDKLGEGLGREISLSIVDSFRSRPNQLREFAFGIRNDGLQKSLAQFQTIASAGVFESAIQSMKSSSDGLHKTSVSIEKFIRSIKESFAEILTGVLERYGDSFASVMDFGTKAVIGISKVVQSALNKLLETLANFKGIGERIARALENGVIGSGLTRFFAKNIYGLSDAQIRAAGGAPTKPNQIDFVSKLKSEFDGLTKSIAKTKEQNDKARAAAAAGKSDIFNRAAQIEALAPKLGLLSARTGLAESQRQLQRSVFGADFNADSINKINQAIQHEIDLNVKLKNLHAADKSLEGLKKKVELENKIVQLQTKQRQNLTGINALILESVKSTATTSARFSKILTTRNKNIQAGLSGGLISPNKILGSTSISGVEPYRFGRDSLDKYQRQLQKYMTTGPGSILSGGSFAKTTPIVEPRATKIITTSGQNKSSDFTKQEIDILNKRLRFERGQEANERGLPRSSQVGATKGNRSGQG